MSQKPYENIFDWTESTYFTEELLKNMMKIVVLDIYLKLT